LTLVYHGSVISLRFSFRFYLSKGFIHIPKQIAMDKILQSTKRVWPKRETNDVCLIFINYNDLVVTNFLNSMLTFSFFFFNVEVEKII